MIPPRCDRAYRGHGLWAAVAHLSAIEQLARGFSLEISNEMLIFLGRIALGAVPLFGQSCKSRFEISRRTGSTQVIVYRA